MPVTNPQVSPLEAAEYIFQFRGEFKDGQKAQLNHMAGGAIAAQLAGQENAADISAHDPIELDGDFTFENGKRRMIKGAGTELDVAGVAFRPTEVLYAIQTTRHATEHVLRSSRTSSLTSDGKRHFVKDSTAKPELSLETEVSDYIDYSYAFLGRLMIPKELVGGKVSDMFIWPEEFYPVRLATVYPNTFVITVADEVQVPGMQHKNHLHTGE
jgi:hypothetical protein